MPLNTKSYTFNMISSFVPSFLLLLLCLENLTLGAYAFTSASVTVGQRRFQQQRRSTSIWAKKDGYKFGDISRGLIGKFQKDVNSVTGKEKYEFGRNDDLFVLPHLQQIFELYCLFYSNR